MESTIYTRADLDREARAAVKRERELVRRTRGTDAARSVRLAGWRLYVWDSGGVALVVDIHSVPRTFAFYIAI